MTIENLDNQTSENQVERALLTPDASPMPTYTIRELKNLELVRTPMDVPLFTMLTASPDKYATTGARYFEWLETDLSSNFAGAVGDGYDLSAISEAGGTPVGKGNYLMAIYQIARVGGMNDEFNTVDGDAMLLETKHKYAQLIRAIEYFLWNGDHTANANHTNGLVTLITNSIPNGGGALVEAVLQTAIVTVIDNGLMPDTIFCLPIHGQRIASFSQNRITYQNTVEAEGGVGQRAFYYNTPFGYTCKVQPVRSVFLPTGSVFVVDSTMMRLRYADKKGEGIIKSRVLPETNDGTAVLLKTYCGLELAQADKHVKISGVASTLT